MHPKISVVTATLNSARLLPRLVASLQAQTDQDFEWVVADGASTDETLEIVEAAKSSLRVVVDSRADFGIYDALNRAVRLASGDYYLVVGADDSLAPEAIAEYRKSIGSSSADLITAGVLMDGRVVRQSSPPWLWLYGSPARISAHSVGVCIRRDLHSQLGFYSSKFPVYADGYFLLKAIRAGVSIHRSDFIAGEFSTVGCSNRNQIFSFAEQFQAGVLTGGNILVQLLLFNLRILKWLGRLR